MGTHAHAAASFDKVPVTTVRAPFGAGLNGVVQIRLGTAAPISVMVDTGSVGLRVFPGGWDGPVSGGFASARMSIGSTQTTSPVTFQVIPTTSSYIAQWRDEGVLGIIGVGAARSPLVNPLTALPGALGRHWSIHFNRPEAGRQGSLVLGDLPPADAQATYRLTTQGMSTNGVPLWNDRAADACWSIGTAVDACVPTWFDSGFHLTRVAGAPFANLPTTAGRKVTPGLRVGLAVPGAAFNSWRFTTGLVASHNAVVLFSKHGKASVNTGNGLYFDFQVTYDLDRGTISVGTVRSR